MYFSKLILAAAAAIGLTVDSARLVVADEPVKASPEQVADTLAKMFESASPEWRKRIEQDETQRVCSLSRNRLSPAEADKMIAREKTRVAFPADGKLLGDWRAGEKLAQIGTGGQFTDAPDTVHGANCYACHELTKREVSFGTLGPSLVGYGKTHGYAADAAKAAYARIFDMQSAVACSIMPRFGANKFLTEAQIKDVTALLFDPGSPVNK